MWHTLKIPVNYVFVKRLFEYADWMTHCGMVPNGVADSIEFQLTSLRGIEVLACSFNTDFNYGLF